jgi:DNA-binding transcriptional LysR family regulator
LSRQIKALEDEIGQCLLERKAHSIRLTPVGEALLREARELLQHAEQVVERVRARIQRGQSLVLTQAENRLITKCIERGLSPVSLELIRISRSTKRIRELRATNE